MIKLLWNWMLGRGVGYRPNLTVYFKSGNKVTLRRVANWKLNTSPPDGKITYLSLTQSDLDRRLLITSVALDQIEAIVEHG